MEDKQSFAEWFADRKKVLKKEYLNGIINGKERLPDYERFLSDSREDYQDLMWKAEHKTMERP